MLRNIFNRFRNFLLRLRIKWLRARGSRIHPGAVISFKARIDFTNPKGIIIDDGVHVTFDSKILAHDFSRKLRKDTHIKENCFIGAGSIIMPGVTVGPQSIVAAGAVVTKDVPPHCIVAGNPAVVIRTGIRLGPLGRILDNHNGGAK